jgi:thiamine-phosphate pyrophosphorylase
MARTLPMGLYAIADASHGDPVDLARRLAAAGCRSIQLRAKEWTPSQVEAAAGLLAPELRAAGVCFIINDHAEIARNVGASGVHIGQTDGPILQARELVGPDLLIGRSTHTLDQAQTVKGADYIGFGPVFSTISKANAPQPRGLALLASAVEVAPCPVVAIGGVGQSEVDKVQATGAHGWACIAALLGTEDLAAAVAAMQRH